MSQNDGYTPLTGVVPIPVSTEPLPCRLPPRVYDRKQSHDYPRYYKAIKIALRSLMLREPPKGRRYSKKAVDTWEREGRYSESRAKGNSDDGVDTTPS